MTATEPFAERAYRDDNNDLRDCRGNRPEAYFADGPGGRYCVRKEPVMVLPPGTRPGYGHLEDIRLTFQWQAEFQTAECSPMSLGLPLVLYKGDDFDEACAACDSDYDRRQRAWLWAQLHTHTDPMTEDRIRELIRQELHDSEAIAARIREIVRDECHTPEGDS